tara:strand:- start:627 stop:1058 length:432 start_codon:yes stop_codon:yes gene_type:complete
MPTTTATITLNSQDITGDPLNLSKQATLTKAQEEVGLNQFTGITTLVYASAQTATPLVLAASYAGAVDGSSNVVAHKVYIRNTSESPADFVNIEIGSSNVSLGKLYAGDWAFLPWDGHHDIDVDISGALTIEFGVFSQSAVTA